MGTELGSSYCNVRGKPISKACCHQSIAQQNNTHHMHPQQNHIDPPLVFQQREAPSMLAALHSFPYPQYEGSSANHEEIAHSTLSSSSAVPAYVSEPLLLAMAVMPRRVFEKDIVEPLRPARAATASSWSLRREKLALPIV
eukprot:6214073-Pleurochrysis_carterae.AAC.4